MTRRKAANTSVAEVTVGRERDCPRRGFNASMHAQMLETVYAAAAVRTVLHLYPFQRQGVKNQGRLFESSPYVFVYRF